jgi:heme A synthase
MDALIHGHSGLRWLALALLVFAIVNALLKLKSGKYEKGDKMLNLFAMVMLHIQVTLGIVVSFVSGKISYAEGWMKNPQYRFFGLEHILLMVIAVTLATIGRKKAEKALDPAKKHKTILIWYTIVLIIIFAAIPWPFRTALGGSWF